MLLEGAVVYLHRRRPDPVLCSHITDAGRTFALYQVPRGAPIVGDDIVLSRRDISASAADFVIQISHAAFATEH
jgi:hypothetical protein